MPKRKAVVLGINDYQGSDNDLPSCVADAKAFKRLLASRFGYAKEDVHILTDEAVTRAAVGKEMDWLFDKAGPDDRLVFYYSGHGYQQAQDGVREEYLVLYDGLFHDDEFSNRTQDLPTGVLTVVLDCCFGGGMEKVFNLMLPAAAGLGGLVCGGGMLDAPTPVKVWTPPDMKRLREDLIAAREASRIKPFGRGVLTASKARAPGSKAMVLSGADEAGQRGMKGLLVSACLEDETAAASTSVTGGLSAFTYGLTRVLAGTSSAISTKDLVARATALLRSSGFKQTPQIKEPAAPPGASGLSFIELGAVQKQDEAPGGVSVSPIVELIARLFSKEQTMSGIDVNALLQLLAMAKQGGGGNKGYGRGHSPHRGDRVAVATEGAATAGCR